MLIILVLLCVSRCADNCRYLMVRMKVHHQFKTLSWFLFVFLAATAQLINGVQGQGKLTIKKRLYFTRAL